MVGVDDRMDALGTCAEPSFKCLSINEASCSIGFVRSRHVRSNPRHPLPSLLYSHNCFSSIYRDVPPCWSIAALSNANASTDRPESLVQSKLRRAFSMSKKSPAFSAECTRHTVRAPWCTTQSERATYRAIKLVDKRKAIIVIVFTVKAKYPVKTTGTLPSGYSCEPTRRA